MCRASPSSRYAQRPPTGSACTTGDERRHLIDVHQLAEGDDRLPPKSRSKSSRAAARSASRRLRTSTRRQVDARPAVGDWTASSRTRRPAAAVARAAALNAAGSSRDVAQAVDHSGPVPFVHRTQRL